MAFLWNGSFRLWSNGATTSTWVTPATDVYGTSAFGVWEKAYKVFACVSVDFAGNSTWDLILTSDKYAPLIEPQSVSATPGATHGRPSKVFWTEDTTAPGGGSYQLDIVPHNLTQGLQDTTITLSAPRAPGSYNQSYTAPGGWNPGDEIYFALMYDNGGVGPEADTNTIVLP